MEWNEIIDIGIEIEIKQVSSQTVPIFPKCEIMSKRNMKINLRFVLLSVLCTIMLIRHSLEAFLFCFSIWHKWVRNRDYTYIYA